MAGAGRRIAVLTRCHVTTSPWPLFWIEETDSTNAQAARRLAEGHAAGFWLGADRQTAGRGRRGRAWYSGRGNLMLSGAVPPGIAPADRFALSFIAGLAMHDFASSLPAMPDVHLKWPNDLEVEGAKLGGALVESLADETASAIMGIGINLMDAPRLPDRRTCALSEFIADVPPPQLAARQVGAHVERRLADYLQHGFGPVRDAWLKVASGLGERVAIHTGSEVIEGRFVALAERGALVLETSAGRRTFDAGDVSLRQHLTPSGPQEN